MLVQASLSAERLALRHEEVPVEAEITRIPQATRLLKGGGIAVVGILLGPATIWMPGVHMVSTWLLPLLGIGIGFYVYRIEMKLGTITGTCPSCTQRFEIEGGTVDEPMWLRCNHCQHPLEFLIPTDNV